MTGVSWESCQHTLSKELKMHRVAAKFVHRILTHDQKQTHLDVCHKLKEQLEDDLDLFL